MFMSKLTIAFLFSILTSLFALVAAFPVEVARDVWDPQILSPNASTLWVVGQQYNVTWNTTDAPSDISNEGLVIFGQNGTLDTSDPLAEGFDLRTGWVTVTSPNVTTGSDYFIVLFGDSGNDSPYFTVTNPDETTAQ